jgi:hypothetical protein
MDNLNMSLAQIILDQEPPYEGKDPNLHDHPYCSTCYDKSSEEKPLLKCSRCKLVYYCSVDCQKENFGAHKKTCKHIVKLVANLIRETAPLISGPAAMMWGGGGPPDNWFETQVGMFWGLHETRDYMRARLALVNEICNLSFELETVELWENVLGHYQDMLRLCFRDNLGLRYRFPYFLLSLNRDDDAYCFVRYWMKDFDQAEVDGRGMQSQHAESNHW